MSPRAGPPGAREAEGAVGALPGQDTGKTGHAGAAPPPAHAGDTSQRPHAHLRLCSSVVSPATAGRRVGAPLKPGRNGNWILARVTKKPFIVTQARPPRRAGALTEQGRHGRRLPACERPSEDRPRRRC